VDSVSAQIGSPLDGSPASTVPNGLASSPSATDIPTVRSEWHSEMPSATSGSELQDSDLCIDATISHSIAEQTSFHTNRT
jgi:hypothetical protein